MKQLLLQGCICLMACLWMGQAYAQSVKVTGKVIETGGAPVPGATVILKNTRTTGTTTAVDGSFSLNVPSGSTLVVSAIGFSTQEVALQNRTAIDVRLTQSSSVLNEVVVTALGVTQEKRSLTYSTQEVKSEQLMRAKEPNVLNALTGKVAGVQITNSSGMPGASARIVVRGATSLLGNNQALIVLDGIPINNDETGNADQGGGGNRLVDLDPSIIESVNVLKGAAATTLYGSAGAGGVVIITTKSGSGSRKPTIAVSSDLSFDKALYPDLQHKYSQGDRRTVNGVTLDGQFYNGEDQKTSSSWGALMDTLRINGQPAPRYSLPDLFFRTGVSTNNSVSISGSPGDRSSYFTSYTYFNQKGIIPTTDLIRNTLFAKYVTQISPKVNATFQLNYTSTDNNRVPEGYSLQSPLWTVFAGPISWNPFPTTNPDGSQRVYRYSRNNPFWALDNIHNRSLVNRYIPVVTINYQPTEWLTIIERGGADMYGEQVKYSESRGSANVPTGQIVDQVNTFRQFNNDLIVRASRQVGNLDLSLTLGNNLYSSYSQNILTRGVGVAIANFDNMSNTEKQTYSENHYLTRKIGFYGQANFDYRRMLVLALTGRYDGSSVLSQDQQFYPYGSAAFAFIFSELFPANLASVINFGKLRVSTASVGNDNIGAYRLNTPFQVASISYGAYNFPFQGQNGFLQNASLGNANLRNERTNEVEVGLEMRFLKNRISFETSYFRKNSVDLLTDGIPVSAGSGYTSTILNAGTMQTKGFEFLLNATPVRSGKFAWDATFNFTRIRSIVTQINGGLDRVQIGTSWAVVGQRYGTLIGNQYARNEQGQLLINDQGLPYIGNTGITGNISPDWLMGLNNSLRYGAFSLNAFIDMRKGGNIINSDDKYGYFYGTPKLTENRQPRVVPGINAADGTPNTKVVQAEDYFRQISGIDEAAVQEVTYIKLRTLGLTYNVAAGLLAKTPFKTASLSVTGRNLFIYRPHFTGSDPEVSSYGSGNAAQGIYANSAPSSRSVLFSLRFSF